MMSVAGRRSHLTDHSITEFDHLKRKHSTGRDNQTAIWRYPNVHNIRDGYASRLLLLSQVVYHFDVKAQYLCQSSIER